MTNILQTKQLDVQRIGITTMGIFTILIFTMFFSIRPAHADISSQSGIGSSGNNVTELQQFLATNSQIYPDGRVTGYFGPLTQAAVRQFQTNYDISQVGMVGPETLARMNGVINSGLGLDISAPVISNLSVQTSGNGAQVSWNTNTLAYGKVFYSTQPLSIADAQTSFLAPYVSGAVTSNATNGYSQSITLSNLQPNTTYYSLVEASDSSGNVSVAWLGTFHTNQF